MREENKEYICDVKLLDGVVALSRPKEELIRCKDCKYFSTDFNGYNHCDLYMDALSPWAESRYSPSESDYCSQAERKEE